MTAEHLPLRSEMTKLLRGLHDQTFRRRYGRCMPGYESVN
jgi:hypothetical protein